MRSLFNFFGLIALSMVVFSCKKETSLENNEVPVVIDAAWEFTEGANLFQGDIDTAYLATEPGVKMLTLEGTTLNGNGTLMIQIIGDLKPGATFTSPSLYFQYAENGSVVFDNIPYDANFSLTISSLDSVSISGTFTGLVLDAQGGQRTITGGKFTAAIEGLTDDTVPQPEPELDYFPLAKSWSYQDGSQPIPEELTITSVGTEEIEGRTYTVFENEETGERKYYRVEGSNYYQYVTLDFKLGAIGAPTIDLLILKDDEEVGVPWFTDGYQVNISGIPTTVRLEHEIISKNISLTLNGEVYNDVIEVETRVGILVGGVHMSDASLSFSTYYAKGVGIISYQESDGSRWELVSYTKE